MSVTISKRVEIPGSLEGGTVKVRSSSNLRCIIEHNRATRSKPLAIICPADENEGCYIGLEWPNGDYACVYFASRTIAIEWFTKRASNVEFL